MSVWDGVAACHAVAESKAELVALIHFSDIKCSE